MDRQELARLLMGTFLDELQEHVGGLSKDLLTLEKKPSPEERSEAIARLFRAAHSLKGAAAVVHADPIRDACHSMEDLFSELREGETDLNKQQTSVLLASVDAIEDYAKRMRAGDRLTEAPLHGLLNDLSELSIEQEQAVDLGATSAPSETPAAEKAPAEKTPSQQTELSQNPSVDSNANPSATSNEPTASELAPAQQTATSPADVSAPAAGPSRDMTAATIRVSSQKLDALLAHSGELLVARGRFACRVEEASELRDSAYELRKQWRESEALLRETLHRFEDPIADDENRQPLQALSLTHDRIQALTSKLESLAGGFDNDVRHLKQTCQVLDDEIYNVRMLPFAAACSGLERVVRDIASSSNKQIHLDLQFDGVEVDRSVLEGLKDPLIHLVRNAADHGVESSPERIAAGKNPEANIVISASLRGGQVEVVVRDDGRGFDLEKIRATATRHGIDIPDAPHEQARLVFAAGFSTAPMVTDLSGRGVGLDVVQNQIESLHGSVDVQFTEGQGTKFTLLVPLTLTTIRALLVETHQQQFAIPTPVIEQVIRFDASDLKMVGGNEVFIRNRKPTRLVALRTALGLTPPPPPGNAKRLAVILAVGEHRVALAVDEIHSEQEVLVKNLGARVRRLRHFSGCTLLPSGQVALVINATNVTRTALGIKTRSVVNSASGLQLSPPKRVLVVEDSVTTRTLMVNIFQTAGFDVAGATDGENALQILQEQSFDLIVSDVDMPKMDGFTLTDRVRKQPSHSEVPVILVTARGSDHDKQRGIDVGANAYIEKGSFDQQILLKTAHQLL
ncbi:Gliding motility regulatory protein [Roseimaritima multifibrata]|uniref:histidine kinase n=1 Tax=Roseimaritima multifibrata TaxID=1930274 RepID=A0A517MDE6_9BACT|nr:response regulator [Roseimaritima multifibrata]QDS92911.1 Gliding motility regulatory protein [Roseimaritima multifibrata]